MKTIAQQLNIKEFPFEIRDKSGNKIYYEDSDNFWCIHQYDKMCNVIYYKSSRGFWFKKEFNKSGKLIYYENSYGRITDNRPKQNMCLDTIIEIECKKYKLREI